MKKMGGGGVGRCNREVKFLCKFQKKLKNVGGGVGSGGGGGSEGTDVNKEFKFL